MNQFGQVPIVVSTLLMLLLATYLGLFIGAYAWGFTRLQSGYPGWLWLSAPSLWVSLEYLRTYAFSGFPWTLLGYSQYQWLSVIQVSDMAGVYGVSFLLVMGNASITILLFWLGQPKGHSFRILTLAASFGLSCNLQHLPCVRTMANHTPSQVR